MLKVYQINVKLIIGMLSERLIGHKRLFISILNRILLNHQLSCPNLRLYVKLFLLIFAKNKLWTLKYSN